MYKLTWNPTPHRPVNSSASTFLLRSTVHVSTEEKPQVIKWNKDHSRFSRELANDLFTLSNHERQSMTHLLHSQGKKKKVFMSLPFSLTSSYSSPSEYK